MDDRFRQPIVTLDEEAADRLLAGQMVELSVSTANMRADDCKEGFPFPAGLPGTVTVRVRIVSVVRRIANPSPRNVRGRMGSHRVKVVHAPQQ